jgi:hypothetical protein
MIADKAEQRDEEAIDKILRLRLNPLSSSLTLHIHRFNAGANRETNVGVRKFIESRLRGSHETPTRRKQCQRDENLYSTFRRRGQVWL